MGKFAFRAVGQAANEAAAAATAPAAAAVIEVQATKVAEVTPAPAVAAVAPVAATPAQEAVKALVPTAAVGPVKAATGAVTEYKGRPAYADDSESIGTRDITMPRINIVQKVGDLSNIFTPGDIVLNKESVIYKAPKTDPKTNSQIPQSEPLQMVICGFRPDRWAEKTVGGEQGAIVDTVEQVVAGGGTISYDEAEATGNPLFQQLSEALVLIKKPKDITDPAFSYKADGELWVPVLWAMKGSAYTNGAKLFRTVRKAGWLKDEVNPATGEVIKKSAYFHGLWDITTYCKAYRTGFFAWIPVPKRATVCETGPEVRVLAEKVLG